MKRNLKKRNPFEDFSRTERICGRIFMGLMLASAGTMIIGYIQSEHQESLLYQVSTKISVFFILTSMLFGLWLNFKPRFCPKCGIKMLKVKSKEPVTFRCSDCGFEYETNLTSP